jgi:two-component sensor histidine kinase
MAEQHSVTSALRLDTLPGRLSFLTAALLCVILLIFVANRVTDSASRSIEILMLNEKMLGVLRDAETGQRGYLITADPSFLQPYQNAEKEYFRLHANLSELVTQSPVQLAELTGLRQLAKEKFDEMERTVALAQSKKVPEAVQAVQAGRGKAIMDDIRARHVRFAVQEDQIYRARATSATFWRNATVVGLAFVAGVVALMSWLEFQSSARSRAALTSTNLLLEERVRKRTLDLEKQNKRVESLLADVSHRVGNNLATVAALLSIQSRQHSSAAVKEALTGASERVQAIAAGQRRLRLNVDHDLVEAKSYLEDLIDEIRQRVAHQRVEIGLDVSDVQINGGDAISIVILINELVTNAVKHAFLTQDGGIVQVSCHYLSVDDKTIELAISDNGSGMAAEEGHAGLGSKIISGLLQTLDARRTTCSSSNDPDRPGTCVRILIPPKPA